MGFAECAVLGSNQRPPACRAGALPTELTARETAKPTSGFRSRMGPGCALIEVAYAVDPLVLSPRFGTAGTTPGRPAAAVRRRRSLLGRARLLVVRNRVRRA